MDQDIAPTTGEGQGHQNDVSDSDSGIGTGSGQSTPSQSATSTPSQSATSTPSQSEISTPTMSPKASDGNRGGAFSFPSDVLEGLQIGPSNSESGIATGSDRSTSSQSATSTPSQSEDAATNQESSPSAMETDAVPQTPSLQTWQTTASPRPENVEQGTATRLPQMDRQGFYRDQRSTTTTTTSTTKTTTKTRKPEEERPGVFRQPNPPTPTTIQIFITNFNGKTETLQIREDAGVTGLKKLVHDKLGVPPSQQRLNYQGRELQDGCSLASYGVKNLSTINLLGRLRGGAKEQC